MRMAKLAMEARRQIVLTAPERTRPLNFHFPIWKELTYRPWQVRLGLGLLASMAPSDVPLEQRMISPRAAQSIPLVGGLRDWDRLQGVGAFTEYQFEWPERLCVDAVLDAERLGASVRNYTAATKLTRRNEAWEVELSDVHAGGAATIECKLVLNMAGIWMSTRSTASRARPVRARSSEPRAFTSWCNCRRNAPTTASSPSIARMSRSMHPLARHALLWPNRDRL